MSIDLTQDPFALFTEHIAKKNLNVDDITTDDLTIQNMTDLSLPNWPMAYAYTNSHTTVNGGLSLVPYRLWKRDSGAYIARKTLTLPAGEITFSAWSDNITILFIDGIEQYTGTAEWDVTDVHTFTVEAGDYDIAIVCRNSVNYGSIAFSFTQDDTVLYLSDSTWSLLDISSRYMYYWYNAANTLYTSWPAPKVQDERVGWSDPDNVGKWLVPANDQRYSMFGMRKSLTPTGDTLTINCRADNNVMISVGGSEFAYVSNYTHTISVTPDVEVIVAIILINITGPSGIQFELVNTDGSILDSSDASWLMARVGWTDTTKTVGEWDKDLFTYAYKTINYLDYVTDITTVTSVEADLTIQPSEVTGDYVEFMYKRIDINRLFGSIDAVKDVTHHDFWPKAVVHDRDDTYNYAEPSGTTIAPTFEYTVPYSSFLVKREINFSGSEVTLRIRADDFCTLYIDGVELDSVSGFNAIKTITFTPEAGVRTFTLEVGNNTGPSWVMFDLTEDDVVIDQADTTWACYDILDTDNVLILRDIFRPDTIELEYDSAEVTMLSDSVADNGNASPALIAHFLRRYGVNLGDSGVTVTEVNASGTYTVTIDNIVYLGNLTLSPYGA